MVCQSNWSGKAVVKLFPIRRSEASVAVNRGVVCMMLLNPLKARCTAALSSSGSSPVNKPSKRLIFLLGSNCVRSNKTMCLISAGMVMSAGRMVSMVTRDLFVHAPMPNIPMANPTSIALFMRILCASICKLRARLLLNGRIAHFYPRFVCKPLRMIYAFMKFWVKLSLKAYFRKIEVNGAQYLEETGAIFVSNHPSALLDPIVVAISTKRPLHFIAGAEWFGTGLKSWFFQRQFNMIPVFRPWLKKEGEAPVNNEDMFRACHESLSAGARIIIYPEASSVTVPWVRALKTGAARIKLGADSKSGGNTPIIPIGLNYTNPHRFQTRVLINVGKPVEFDEINRLELDEVERVKRMTDKIREAMKELVLHIDEEEVFPVVKNANKLLTDALLKEKGLAPQDTVSAFEMQKAIVQNIESFKRKYPGDKLPFEQRLQRFIDTFEGLGLRRFNPFEVSVLHRTLLWLGVVFTAPLFVFGLVINGLPYALTKWVFDRMLKEKVTGEHKQGELNPAFAGTLAYAVGLVIFLMWYAGIAIALSQFFVWWVIWPLSWFSGYWVGRFTLLYLRWASRIRKLLTWNHFKRSDAKAADLLLTERASLIAELREFVH
jgi:glycerol-3-phosphate O-acyltransferase/dihydroxyacetone phosphate acyltransferase